MSFLSKVLGSEANLTAKSILKDPKLMKQIINWVSGFDSEGDVKMDQNLITALTKIKGLFVGNKTTLYRGLFLKPEQLKQLLSNKELKPANPIESWSGIKILNYDVYRENKGQYVRFKKKINKTDIYLSIVDLFKETLKYYDKKKDEFGICMDIFDLNLDGDGVDWKAEDEYLVAGQILRKKDIDEIILFRSGKLTRYSVSDYEKKLSGKA